MLLNEQINERLFMSLSTVSILKSFQKKFFTGFSKVSKKKSIFSQKLQKTKKSFIARVD